MSTHGKDLTQGKIAKQLWSVAWPMMLSMFFFTLYNLVDAFWVSKLSPEAIAAVSISQITLFAMMSLAMGISVGSSVLMGMSLGAGNKENAEKILGQGYLLSIFAGLFFSVVAFVFREPLLHLSGAIPSIYPLALPFFTVSAIGSVLTFLMMATSTAFNAQGDNFTATKFFAVSVLTNAILDPIMIFGYFGVPAMGIAGAAWATLISQAVFLVLALRVLMSDRMMVPLRLKNLRLKWESVKKVFKIGLPASLTQTLNPVGFSALMVIVAGAFLEAGAAAFSIGFRIEFFAFIPAIGFGFGSMAMMGQNVGAGNFERVREIFRTVVRLAAGTALGFAALAFIFAPLIVGVFTDDPTVTEYALQYFRIVPFGYAFFAVAFVEASVFQGLGRSWPGFWITFGRMAITFAIAFTTVKILQMPIWSVWAALVVGSVTSSILGYIWVKYAIEHAKRHAVTPHPASAEESMPAPIA
jgi:putative MATE family efflux protein